MNRTHRFVIKKDAHGQTSTFTDLLSDYTAVVDDAGIRLVSAVFQKPPESWTAQEKEVVAELLAEKVITDSRELHQYHSPQLRNSTPLQKVELEVTRQCNLRCRHCFTAQEDGELDPDRLEKLADEFQQAGVVEVIFNGGEVLLHSRLKEVLDQFQGRFKLILFSNVTLLDEARLEILQAARVARVNVSLDGFQSSHESLRGPGSHAAALRGIRLLVARRIPVLINTVVWPENFAELEDFISFCREDLVVSGVKLSTIYPLGRAEHSPELGETGPIADRLYHQYMERREGTVAAGGPMPCAAGIRQAFIDCSGNIFPCRLFADPRFQLGRIDEGFLASYRRWSAIPSEFTNFQPDQLADCRHCPALRQCLTGCRARAWLQHGSTMAPDSFVCPHYLPADDPRRNWQISHDS